MDDAIENRYKTGNTRNDLIDTIIAIKNEPKNEENSFMQNDDFLHAQAAVFYSAGFETTSTVISYGLFEIAKNVSTVYFVNE